MMTLLFPCLLHLSISFGDGHGLNCSRANGELEEISYFAGSANQQGIVSAVATRCTQWKRRESPETPPNNNSIGERYNAMELC